MLEGRGERATGTPNTIYDLSSVLFHALEGGASYDTYVQDAEEAGDEELASFFRQVRDEDSARADEAQRLLAERTSSTTAGAGGGDVGGAMGGAVSSEGLAAGVPPGAEPAGVTPGMEPMEDVPPPRTEEAPPPPMEERPLGMEGTMPPATEGAPPGTEGPVSPRAGEQERTGRGERDQEEDKELIDRVRDAISGEEEDRERREGPGEPGRR